LLALWNPFHAQRLFQLAMLVDCNKDQVNGVDIIGAAMKKTASAELCGWTGPPVSLREPGRLTSAAVFSSPHSGRRYPESFRRVSRLDDVTLRASEDAFIDDIFSMVPKYGAPLLSAEFPRAFADPNRGEDELDPALIARMASRKPRTLRVSAGLGVVPRIVAEGTPIYDGKLGLDEVEARIECCYRPFHDTLAECLDRADALFGTSMLIDCHSMPSDNSRRGARRAEIVLGDCYGSSASNDISDAAFTLFRNAGFRVGRNAPFAGGYITQQYGAPQRGRHALQIEIDRSLYLDQKRILPNSNYADLKRALEPIVAQLSRLPQSLSQAMAAE
jgi:N-formylglutamate amidohydrolase